MMWHYLASMRSHKLANDDMDKLLAGKLRAHIEFCYSTIPYYHEVFNNLGLKPSDIQDTDDTRKLPPLTKQDILANYQKILNPNLKPTMIRSTTGTTSKSLSIAYSARYLDICNALRYRRNKILGTSIFDKTVWMPFLGPNTPSGTGSSESDGEFAPTLRRVWKLLFGSFFLKDFTLKFRTMGLNSQNIDKVSRELISFKPDILHSRPSYLRRMAIYLQQQGTALRPKKLLVEGERLSNGMKSDLEDFYQAEVFDVIGAREFGGLGYECPAHSGLHLNSDYFLFEFLHNGEPASEGELAEMLITGLHNEAMPLIRYKIGDVVVPTKRERCECGSNLVRLKSIDGRMSDGLVSTNGERIAAGPVIEFLESVLNMRDYQLMQHAPFIFELKVAAGRSIQEGMVEALILYLKEKIAMDPDLRIERWDETQMPVKYRPVLSTVRS